MRKHLESPKFMEFIMKELMNHSFIVKYLFGLLKLTSNPIYDSADYLRCLERSKSSDDDPDYYCMLRKTFKTIGFNPLNDNEEGLSSTRENEELIDKFYTALQENDINFSMNQSQILLFSQFLIECVQEIMWLRGKDMIFENDEELIDFYKGIAKNNC
jgi:hypothetical protein